MDFGKNLSRLRKEKNLSQEKLAELMEVSRQAVTKWESGKSFPDTENLIRLSEIFDISLDELCRTETKKPQPQIHPVSHILALFSLLILAAYCVIGGLNGNFSGEVLIILLILALPMHCITHLIFWGMIKSGEFTFLAGYDPNIKYDTDGMKRYVAGLDFMLGLETTFYLFMIASAALLAPEFKIYPVLVFGYIFSFVAGIFFMGYKFGDQIYLDPADAKRAKRGFPASAIMVAMLLISVAAFVVIFELKGYENNSAKSFPLLGMMFLSIGFSLGGYFAESARLKKTDEEKPLFGKAFVICNILAVAAIAAMAIL